MPPSAKRDNNSIDYYGELSWANLLDWMATFCLGGILALTALQLGGVRPDTQLLLQPLYVLLLVLHGLSFALSRGDERTLNGFPFLYVPFLLWALLSLFFWTPTFWRGTHELSYFFSAFFFGWVAVNNVRTREHLWTLIVISIVPLAYGIFIGYYQFFQDPMRIAEARLSYPVVLSAQYRGEATGLFADSGSFAALLLMALPCFTIASFVPRLPIILRVLCFYLALIFVVGITLTQTYWAVVMVVVQMFLVPWFCFESKQRRFLFSSLSVGAAFIVVILMYMFNPLFERGLAMAITTEGEGIRLLLWEEVATILAKSPVVGSGAGSFSYTVEHSADLTLSRLPLTPHNDLLHVFSNYGLIGGCLVLLPLILVLWRGFSQWLKEPFKLKTRLSHIMTTQKFLLSLSICGVFAVLLCSAFHFLLYVPALLLYGVLLFAILVKVSCRRSISLPDFRFSGLLYLLVCSVAGAVFWAHFSVSTESQALELQAAQRLDRIVEKGISISGDNALVDKVIALYEDAIVADSGNADAWIGLSMAFCQLHYRDPANYEETGAKAIRAARRAYEIVPGYWLASAQLGVAHALSGERDEAGKLLQRAVEMAPNSSNAHYYYAAFLGGEAANREKAIQQVQRALEINPNNSAARRLERKLLIL